MDLSLLIARMALAGVFGLAATAKLFDRSGFRQTLLDFGAPEKASSTLAVILPVMEIACAAALLSVSFARWGALGTLVLLSLFTLAISANLLRGRTPNCRCFGQLQSTPIGRTSLLRNAVLMLLAGFVTLAGWQNPGPGMVGWLGDFTASERALLIAGLLLLVLVVVEGWFLLQLFHQHGRLLIRLDALESQLAPASGPQPGGLVDGLPVGLPAPNFTLPALSTLVAGGEQVSLEQLRAQGKPVLLVFSDPGCDPCTGLLPEIPRWQQLYSGNLVFTLITRGSERENRAKLEDSPLPWVLLQADWEVARLYRITATPAAVLVLPDGRIGSLPAKGAAGVSDLVERAARLEPPHQPIQAETYPRRNGHDSAGRPLEKIGSPAPALQLPGLNGEKIALADFRGAPVLLLFWNPSCGFCADMLEELRVWEKAAGRDAPELLVISTGSRQENQALGLLSPIVLDHGFSAGRAFGVSGTPSAVLIDASGRLSSAVAVGANEVLALAWQSQKQAHGTPG